MMIQLTRKKTAIATIQNCEVRTLNHRPQSIVEMPWFAASAGRESPGFESAGPESMDKSICNRLRAEGQPWAG
jgi:hypothetical protein